MQNNQAPNIYHQSLPPGYNEYSQPITAPIAYRFSYDPIQVQCPTCRANIVTQISYKAGLLTWMIAGN